jgi:hypothetical protein
MDFNVFLEKLGSFMRCGWTAGLLDIPCTKHPQNHSHLRLRLLPPNTDESDLSNWLSPLESVALCLIGNKNADFKFLNYNDPHISHREITMAADFVDWYKTGNASYIEARLRMLRVCKIEAEYVLFRAPQPRSFVRWQK